MIGKELQQLIVEHLRLRQRVRALCESFTTAPERQPQQNLPPISDGFAAWHRDRDDRRPEREDAATVADNWWVEWCIECTILVGEPAWRARQAAANNRWDGSDSMDLRRAEESHHFPLRVPAARATLPGDGGLVSVSLFALRLVG
ncbi:hypothetical protein FXF51_09030 [Nonomuraea sp. PA05]|uniref:hypothetical protein n=1 Tax=Nonomuraea sp. PA05 TaxID=2604466 RepID=UPI0011D89CEC|nr:hypothetical protein [Nonomuraea sp. PA05]TYB69350.1 hypothetical protein FXF51_09030 [Nonomuraea sp. PA05]